MKNRWLRVSKEAPVRVYVSKTLLQTMVFWTLLLFVVPGMLVKLEAGLWGTPAPGIIRQGLAVLVFAAGGSLGLWSGWTMAVKGRGTPLPLDTAARLVIAGPYRYVRNPMAVGGLVQGFAVSLWLGSWLTAGYVLSGLIIWQVWVRPVEERELAGRFGEPYEVYRKAVRCWWPRIPR